MDGSRAAKMLLSVRLDKESSSREGEMAWTEETLPHDVTGGGTAASKVDLSSETGGIRILNNFLLSQSSAVKPRVLASLLKVRDGGCKSQESEVVISITPYTALVSRMRKIHPGPDSSAGSSVRRKAAYLPTSGENFGDEAEPSFSGREIL